MAIDKNIKNVPDKKMDFRITFLIWLNLLCVLVAVALGLVLKFDLLKIAQTSIYNGLINFGRYFSFFVLVSSVLSGIYVDGRVIKIKKYLFFLIFIFACLALWMNFSAKLRMPGNLKPNSNAVQVNMNIFLALYQDTR